MSDSEESTQRPRPRPAPNPAAPEAVEPEVVEPEVVEPEAVESEAVESEAVESEAQDDRPAAEESTEPRAPMSATSRARRIGGRPVVPTATPDTGEKRRPSPPPPGVGRHVASPPPSTREKAPKPAKEPRQPKEPRQSSESREPKRAKARVGVALSKSSVPAIRRELAPWIPAGVLGLAALVLIVLIAVAADGVYYAKSGVSAGARANEQQTALAASKSCIATINTYDYRTLPKNEAAALACITGTFTTSMKTTYTKTLIPEAPVSHSTQAAQINYAGIQSVNGNGTQIQILLYGQLTVTNLDTATQGAPRYDPFGVVATMNRVHGKWLVSNYVTDTGATGGS